MVFKEKKKKKKRILGRKYSFFFMMPVSNQYEGYFKTLHRQAGEAGSP